MIDKLASSSNKTGVQAPKFGSRKFLHRGSFERARRLASKGMAAGPGPTVAALLALNAALTRRNSALLAALDRYDRTAGSVTGALCYAEDATAAVSGRATLRLVSAQAPSQEERRRLATTTPLLAGLTPRQAQVLHLVLTGHPSKNIAADLNISQRNVENHRAAIMRRTGATSVPALARMAGGAAGSADCKAVARSCSLATACQ